ncbi:hypothetical protein H4R18_003513 [Coemansia javaensis]|uniref:Uncharacterized protein n=1 Tax=Coemansia javaensis TaxID=2761396 RepID=A0A9W8LIA8_9FUNG|nr:hypothetical protein H4R18_003513 [Coemansia javaensis]
MDRDWHRHTWAWPALLVDGTGLLRGGFVPEPPYARLLRTLGLFDSIEAPLPAAAYAAGTPWAHRGPADVDIAGALERLSASLVHDGTRIVDALGEALGDTTRWALSGAFGQLRDAMDRIESRMQRSRPSAEDQDQDQGQGQGQDAPAAAWHYYSVTTRTLPDGSIETRRVVRDDSGAEQTTVTRRRPDGTLEEQPEELPKV